MNMKKNLIVLGAILLFACSESSNVSGTTEMENTMAQGASSSSEFLSSSETLRSSSSVEEMSSSSEAGSSSSNTEKSSSSLRGIEIPPPVGCKPAPLKQVETFGVVDNLISKRVEALELQGLDNKAAKDSATEELYRELGLDSLFYDSTLYSVYPAFQDYKLEYTLYFLYKDPDVSQQMSPKLVEDFADGELDSENFCFDSSPYAGLDELPYKFMPLGCAYAQSEVEDPLAIIRNIWRKCAGMPYCNDDVGDTVITIGNDHFVCQNGSWLTLEMIGKEKNGILCTENGERTKVEEAKNNFVTYICYDSLWRRMLNTPDLPAEYFFNPDFQYGTFEDPRDGHVYRTTVYEGKTWLAQDMDYYDSSDTLFVKQSKCAKVVDYEKHEESENAYCDGASRFYTVNVYEKVCPEGWRLPTKEDWSTVLDMPYDDARSYFQKLYVIGSYLVLGATDEFGLSLRMDGFVDPYGRHFEGSGYNLFWLEGGLIVSNSELHASYKEQNDIRENGPFVPVRCVKE